LSGISIAYFYRRGLLYLSNTQSQSGLTLTGAVCYASQRPAESIYFDSRRRGRET